MRPQGVEASEVVIWVASGLLAVILGIGAAFSLWTGFRGEGDLGLVALLVGGLSGGIGLLGLNSKQVWVKAVIVLFAVTLALSFVVGTPSFARLV